jgi:CheY-like chemotaxis protein
LFVATAHSSPGRDRLACGRSRRCSARSPSTNAGSTFTGKSLEKTRMKGDYTLQADRRLSASAAVPPTVLCIDDDPEVSRLIESYLRDVEVTVLRSFHGMQGYAAAIKHDPGVIVMDVAMPNGNGLAILDCLKRNRDTAAIPVILLSGMRDPSLPRRMFEMGADQFLHKPVHSDALRHELSRFIDLRPRK